MHKPSATKELLWNRKAASLLKQSGWGGKVRGRVIRLGRNLGFNWCLKSSHSGWFQLFLVKNKHNTQMQALPALSKISRLTDPRLLPWHPQSTRSLTSCFLLSHSPNCSLRHFFQAVFPAREMCLTQLWNLLHISILVFVLNRHYVCVSRFSHAWLFETPWAIAYQALLSTGFSRQEHCSRLPFPPPGDRRPPRDRIWVSPALQADSLLFEPSGKPWFIYKHVLSHSVVSLSAHVPRWPWGDRTLAWHVSSKIRKAEALRLP